MQLQGINNSGLKNKFSEQFNIYFSILHLSLEKIKEMIQLEMVY